ncbi:phage/plasmid primase, P4 family [Ferriphaselus sp. R-1]|uniref:DNA primase family protein n=1 Tax=Ferriphaselus sp. R-1 TaxID=1485544 RepID=UPI00068B5279|nr:phage/plasmid primase, P4 family [Ferriphaselus sp. R-1]
MTFKSKLVGERPADTYPPETPEQSQACSPNQPPSKASKPSLDKVFADLMLTAPNRNMVGPWAMKTESTADAGCMYRWGKYCWEYVHAEEGKAIASQWLDIHYPDKATAQTASAIWNYACARLRQAKPLPDSTRSSIIPTLSGYLDIQQDGSIQVMRPAPEYGVDYVIQANLGHQPHSDQYQPNHLPESSLFGRFLNVSLPDPAIRDVVQELCGQTLLAANYGVAGWFVGQGANGKGVLMEVVEAIHRQACRLRLDRLSANFALEPLIGASLVLVDEVANARFDEELFKTLITGNGIDINRKYDKPLRSYRSRAKWIISSNNVPHIADKSDGVWRRIVFVPWQVQVPESERIADLDKKIIADELHLVLDWLLEGAIRIVRRGRMLTEVELPETIRSQKQTMRLESDSLLAWIEEEGIHSSSTVWTANDQIYRAYADWCEAAQRTPLGVEMFWKGLRHRFQFETRQKRQNKNGKTVRIRESSVSLKPKADTTATPEWKQPTPNPAGRIEGELFICEELPF